MTLIITAKQFRHHLTLILMAFFMLLFTPVQGEMIISGTSNLDTLDYDLDNIHIKLEKLESRWQIFLWITSFLWINCARVVW